MIDKFMKVVKDSSTYRILEEIEEAKKVWRKVANEFCDEFGIESKKLGFSPHELVIELTEKDKQNKKIKTKEDGKTVKRSCYLYKAYVKKCEEAGLCEMRTRAISWDYNISVYGKHSIERFRLDGTWYVRVMAGEDFSVDPEYEEVITPVEYFTAYEKLQKLNN